MPKHGDTAEGLFFERSQAESVETEVEAEADTKTEDQAY